MRHATDRARLRGQRTLTRLFQTLKDRGLLAGDMQIAAEQFLWLLLGKPLNAALFSPAGESFRKRDLHNHADAAVHTFLAAFGDTERLRRDG